ncbi:MAG: hypothetical protein KIT31_08645 [Deltaproteobacteria bacterium]|nr:hypothetical protein [Deltaproteobacteria bacterium]
MSGRRRALALILVGVAGALAACGGRGGDATASGKRDDAGVPRDGATVHVDISDRPLGMPDLASFAWRKRGGQPAFRVARKHEDKDRWDDVITTTKQALAADPAHLEASWLLAAGLAKQGKLDDVLAPLQLAVAGDFGKWATPSLEHPFLKAWLATPTGEAWKRRLDQDRTAYTGALARGLVVASGGDLYAFDVDGGRWHRLTRTQGAVLGALRVPGAALVPYVSRVRRGGGVAVGVIDLAKGKASRPVDVGGAATIVASTAKASAGLWVQTKGQWRSLDEDGRLGPAVAKMSRPPGPRLEVAGRTVRLVAGALPDVAADWDEAGLASAIRIGKSNRVITVSRTPAVAALIDGNTAAWSPDRGHLAFAAQLDEHCEAGAINAAAFVADAATGTVRELERAAGGLTVEWVADRRIAVAGDRGVHLIDLATGTATALEGAENLAVPRHRPRCKPVEGPDELPPEDPDAAEPGAGSGNLAP